jgi:hypothetical protein
VGVRPDEPGELGTMTERADAGVKWPKSREDRKPYLKPT